MSTERTTIDEIIVGDCVEVLRGYPQDFFSACITDPPYNYEFIGREWNEKEIERRLKRVKNSNTLVKNIPYGSGLSGGVRNRRWYEKNRDNILEYQRWAETWGREVFRTLRPGAFVAVFNSTRTVAHVQIALEATGFYARDILVWRRHSGIPKGINFSKELKKKGNQDWELWEGWHSCLRNEWEAICLLQKPLINNYYETIKNSRVGLLNVKAANDGFQSNIIEGILKQRNENSKIHCTVKPLELIRLLVRLLIHPKDDHVVLDPFAGSGTTCVAAKELGIHYLGVEISEKYCEIARNRLIHTRKENVQPNLF